MKTRYILLAGVIAGTAALASAQDTTTYEQQQTTEQTPDGSQTKTSTKTTTISGSVVKYEPGQTIVIREPSRKVVTYTLSPSVEIPGDITVGKKVTIYTEPGDSGGRMVTRVTTTSMDSGGNVRKTTETTDAEGNVTTRTKTTHVYGTVDAYEAGKSITVTRANGERVTYVVNEKSELPASVAVGKKVTIYSTIVAGSPDPIVSRVTTTSTTAHTKHTVKTDAH